MGRVLQHRLRSGSRRIDIVPTRSRRPRRQPPLRRHLRTSDGDLVVTAGSFLLKTELKKESLGVGCAGE